MGCEQSTSYAYNPSKDGNIIDHIEVSSYNYNHIPDFLQIGSVLDVCYADYNKLLTSYDDGSILLFDWNNPKNTIISYNSHKKGVNSIDVDNHQGLFCSVSRDLTIKLWNLNKLI